MKQTTFAALTAVIILGFAGCPADSDGGTTDDTAAAGQGSINVSFTGLPRDEAASLSEIGETLSWMNGTLSISVPSASFPGASYQWYLDNVPLTGATTAVLNRPGTDFSAGRHEITLEIRTADNRMYSKTVRFTVVP